jgi:succinoglycan biosynthesis protein ExoO
VTPTGSPKVSTFAPVVSIVMANHNGARYLSEAIESVRKQSLHELELVVSDDASTDDSVRIVQEAIVGDPRIRLVRSERKGGPGAARNRALATAEGDWIAVMDSDDLMHPERLAFLVGAAQQEGADIVADDLVEFETKMSSPSGRLLTGVWARAPFWVGIQDYIRLNMFYGSGPALGYLKPLFRRSSLLDLDALYDESLRIGEDFDLVLRLLHMGKKFRVYPTGFYYYRKHASSTSHRLNEAVLSALRDANLKFLEKVPIADAALVSAVARRARSIDTAFAYEQLLQALKARNWSKALGIAATKPSAAALLRLPIGVRMARIFRLASKGDPRMVPPNRGAEASFDANLRGGSDEARKLG